MSNELEKMWKEAVVAEFEVLTRHLPGGTEEKHEKNASGDSRSPVICFNPGCKGIRCRTAINLAETFGFWMSEVASDDDDNYYYIFLYIVFVLSTVSVVCVRADSVKGLWLLSQHVNK
jgi:hypothetical protein